jgi:presenilin-like A22 family membrane protease
MKHAFKITLILLGMFFITQLIGLTVINAYTPTTETITHTNGTQELIEVEKNIPYGLDPPTDTTPETTLVSIVIAILLAVLIMFMLMRFKAEIFLRIWFFSVVALAIGISLNAALMSWQHGALIALAISVPLAYLKVYRRNMIVHNATELLVYPGIAVIFVPLLNIWTSVVLLIIISIYDMYAVWHAGFMQKMANYQIKQLKVFSGFFVPYLGSKQKAKIANLSMKEKATKKIRVNLAILGGGDVIFPLILAGVVLQHLGLFQALTISAGATIALAALFWKSQKGKFYPAMPFISAGCLIALALILVL